MKKAVYGVLVGLLFAINVASAQDMYGNVGIATDYFWRGISLNDGNPAVYGSGGIKIRSIDVGASVAQVDMMSEKDINAQYNVFGSINHNLGAFNVVAGIIHHGYMDESIDALNEVFVGSTFGPLTVKYFNDIDTDGGYWEGNVQLPTVMTVNSSVEYGKNVNGFWSETGNDFFALNLSKDIGNVQVIGKVFDFVDINQITPVNDLYNSFVDGASVSVQYNF